RPAPAAVAEGAGRSERAGEVRLLRVLELEAEPPVVRIEAAQVWNHACEPGKLDAGRLGEGLGGNERRLKQLATECDEVVERPLQPRGRRAAQVGLHPERVEDGLL